MTPTIVTFKWRPFAGYRSTFGPETVHTLRGMVRRHYPHPHRFVCITDDATGLDGIETLPLWDDHAQVPNPTGSGNPSCYRRLKLFAPEMRELLGERIVCLDLDTVITGDLTPILSRPEPFVIWGQSDYPRSQWYNGSLFMMTAGALPHVWTSFNPRTSPRLASKAGKKGSDQGWISYVLGPDQPTVGQRDGVHSYRVHVAPSGVLPDNARVVFFHGKEKPWGYRCQQVAWIRDHYRP